MDTQQIIQSSFCKLSLIISAVFFLSTTLYADYLADQGIYHWQAVDNEILSAARGGFIFSNGVEIDIGVRQVLSISAAGIGSQLDSLNNLQNVSPASTNNLSLILPSGVNIVQNSLDNLTLRNSTFLDIQIKNVTAFKNPAAIIPSFQTIFEPAVFQ